MLFKKIAFELVAGNSPHYDVNTCILEIREYFRYYSLRKNVLLECLRGHVSGHPSAVNVLTSSAKIPDLTKRDIFHLNLSQNDENIE